MTNLVFTKQENVVFHLLPVEQQMEVFFKVWTCKEAYLKATGAGFSQAPDEIELLVAPGEAVRLLSVSGSRQAAQNWHLKPFNLAEGYKATVAVEGTDCRLQCFNM